MISVHWIKGRLMALSTPDYFKFYATDKGQ